MNRYYLRYGTAILLSILLCGLSLEIDVLAKKKPKRRRAARITTSQRLRIAPPVVIAMPRAAMGIQPSAPIPASTGLTPKSAGATTLKSAVTRTPKSTLKAPTLSGPNPSSAAGDLDTSFAGDGKQTQDVTTSDDRALAVAIQSDGKIVVAGYAFGTPGSPGTNNNNFMVARFNTDGSLDDGTGGDSTPGDGAFATAGIFVTDFSTADDKAQAVAIQSDGKIVAAGYATQSSFKNFALIRLTTTGALDSSFDGDGKLTTDMNAGANDEARALGIQSNGRIIAGGGCNNDGCLVRYNTNGSLDDNTGSDTTPGDQYGTAGKVSNNFFAGSTFFNAIVFQSDGKLAAAGRSSSRFALARYTTAGVLDATFGTTDPDGVNGVTTTNFNAGSSTDVAYAVAIQADGKFVLAGNSLDGGVSSFGLVRFNTDGSLDDGSGTDITPLDTFDTDGKRLDDFGASEDTAYGVAVAASGLIYAGGVTNSNIFGSDSGKNFIVACYTTAGGLNPAFGSGGRTVTDFAPPADFTHDEMFGLALQADGKIVGAGVARESSAVSANIGLARYDPATVATPATAGQLIISEFRVRGPGGAQDEFIEIYNASGANHTVLGTGGTGYGIAASDGTTRCTIPDATVIPNGGHFLCVNSAGYSLASYPAGGGTTATGNDTYTTDIPDNAGIALFNNNTGGASYSLANRLDAVGSTSEANAIYREGAGLTPVATGILQYAWVRDTCGKSGSVTTMGLCPRSTPKDTDDNASDFFFIDTAGTATAAGQRLGAPGPENLSSPIQRNSSFAAAILDPCVADTSSPNRERNTTSDPGNNSTFGTLEIRRTITNNTGANVTQLRWRVIDISTSLAPGGIADLRVRSSSDVAGVIVDRAPCGTGSSSITVRGTTLETPPTQSLGGGFNSTLSSGTVTLGSPLANGASIDVRFLLGVEKTGNFKIYLNIEALP